MMDVPKKHCCPLKDTLQMRLNVLSYNSTNVWERDGKGAGGRYWPLVVSAVLTAETSVA